MPFQKQDESVMAKEVSTTFRSDEKFRDWLYSQAGSMDMSVSEFVRAAILLAAPQIKTIRGFSRVQMEDIRQEKSAQ